MFFAKSCKDTKDLLGHGSANTGNDPDGEVSSLKKILSMCILALIIGCTSSNPTINEASVSTDNIVTGQRVLIQVDAISDNPPFTYVWSASGGTLSEEDTANTLYANLWTAPDIPGTYTITCLITDKENNHVSQSFDITVNARHLDPIIDSGVLTIAKQIDSKIGGAWVSIQDSTIKFLSSKPNEDTTWQKNFTSMIARSDPSSLTLAYTVWGVEASSPTTIKELQGTTETDLVCPNCTGINTLAQDVTDSTILWVGDNSGLYYYLSTDATWHTYSSIAPSVTGTFYDFFEFYDFSGGPSAVYAAASTGIYKFEYPTLTTAPITGLDQDTRAVCTVDNDVWSVAYDSGSSKYIVEKNGTPITQPTEAIPSIDVDPIGNIWCGKCWWDGTSWNTIPDSRLDSVNIVKSVVSGEGLIYLLDDSKKLWRW